MAVLQISKIQVRRGKKLESGLPQLASGELAWAIDTQELYIGNGAVGEGAPAVGNTKVFTEHDNLLDLLNQYQYKYDSELGQSLINNTVARSLQARLDDGAVNVSNFGVVNDSPLLDQSDAIQDAIDSLFLNADNANRVVLEFDPGTYLITKTLTIPSNVSLVGSGKTKTIFNFNGSSISTLFSVVDGATNIVLKDFGATTNSTSAKAFNIQNAKDNAFVNIKLTGAWTSATQLLDPIPVSTAIKIDAIGSLTCTGNYFAGIEVSGFTYSVLAETVVTDNTFDGCAFKNSYYGVVFGLPGLRDVGPRRNTVSNSLFDIIYRNGILVESGYGNRSRGNSFVNVGNDAGGHANATTGQIKFLSSGNSSNQDTFDRATLASSTSPQGYFPEIEGAALRQNLEAVTMELPSLGTASPAFRLPLADANSFEVNYIFKNQTGDVVNHVRKGKMHIAVNRETLEVQLVDEYEFVGFSTDENKLIFTTDFLNNSVRVLYKNDNAVGTTSTFTYSYSSLS